ncbi:MAG: hypothetical protein G01um101413_730 [Parcubacteria group bacterium Gr01-1014_13]|nr:MAG: hypothetical protein G01um101413_730 [Parcubacteria group bacterium Gr01-1014_13]
MRKFIGLQVFFFVIAPTFAMVLLFTPVVIRWARHCRLEKLEQDEREVSEYLNLPPHLRRYLTMEHRHFLEEERFRINDKIDKLREKLK